MGDPLLTVIVPTRDRPRYLGAAVTSVLRQTMPDLEILVVDDGSGPEGEAAAARLAAQDRRIRTIRNDEPVGASAARNRALEVARGEFAGFLDDDDEWLPQTAAMAIAHLRHRPELGGVSAWHEVVPDQGRTTVYRGPLEYDAADLLWCNFPAAPFAVLRRAELDPELRFDEELITCEDWDLFLRCARIRPMATIPRALYRYRQRRAPRVTASNARRLEGRRRFLLKHERDMTPLCRSYHAAREEIMATTGLGPRTRLARRLVRRMPGRGTRMIARESFAARVGAVTADPGRSGRLLLTMVRNLPDADRALSPLRAAHGSRGP